MAEHQGEKLKLWLQARRDAAGKKKSLDDIAKELNTSRTTLYYHFGKPELDLNFLERLKEAGYEYKIPDEDEVTPAYLPHKQGNIVYVPLVAYGGFLQGYSNKAFIDSLERFALPGIHGEHFAFEVQGNSMVPIANPGDVVISKREEKLEWMLKGRAYVLQTVDGIIIKLFDRIAEGKAFFKSADRNHNHPSIPLKEIKGVYQVVKVLRDPVAPSN